MGFSANDYMYGYFKSPKVIALNVQNITSSAYWKLHIRSKNVYISFHFSINFHYLSTVVHVLYFIQAVHLSAYCHGTSFLKVLFSGGIE